MQTKKALFLFLVVSSCGMISARDQDSSENYQEVIENVQNNIETNNNRDVDFADAPKKEQRKIEVGVTPDSEGGWKFTFDADSNYVKAAGATAIVVVVGVLTYIFTFKGASTGSGE